jgi:hypothetical protein
MVGVKRKVTSPKNPINMGSRPKPKRVVEYLSLPIEIIVGKNLIVRRNESIPRHLEPGTVIHRKLLYNDFNVNCEIRLETPAGYRLFVNTFIVNSYDFKKLMREEQRERIHQQGKRQKVE